MSHRRKKLTSGALVCSCGLSATVCPVLVAAASLGRLGAASRNRNLTPERRLAIARGARAAQLKPKP